MAPQVVSVSSAATFAFMTLFCAPLGDCQSLIQRSHKVSVVGPSAPHGRKHADYCVNLVNHGTHATVDIEVGTPGQKFSVVADTGSDALIIPSCMCKRIGSCDTQDRCFVGRNHSRTFHMANDPDAVTLSFGSGIIEAVPVKDVVRVGPLHKYMREDGLLLMLSKYLSFSGPFEGILGLGPPPKAHKGSVKTEDLLEDGANRGSGTTAEVGSDEAMEEVIEDVMKQVEDLLSSLGSVNRTSASEREGGGGMPRVAAAPNRHGKSSESWETYKGFIEQADMDNFSVCLDETHGVMRFDVPTASNALGSVGTYHWSLYMQGISVGGESAPVLFCDPARTKHGKHAQAPCAAIPDSGSTHIMGPAAQLDKLFDSICDNWPRCARNHTALVKAAREASQKLADGYSYDPFNIMDAVMSKAEVFQLLLLDCEQWMADTGSFDELPPFHVHLRGSSGSQTLEIPGEYYIMESSTKDYDYVYKHFKEFGHDSSMPNNTHYRKVCTPAMSPFEMTSHEHGDVWILGTPLFYRYVVSYKIEPPQMSFTSTAKTPCGACNGGVGFISSEAAPEQRRPRKAMWPIRRPSIDVNMPL